MNIGPLGIVSSIAGLQRVQAKGVDVERQQLDAARDESQAESGQKADDAAGVGTTKEESEADERDADGRRLWERVPQRESPDEPAAPPQSPRPSPAGTGSQLDLTG